MILHYATQHVKEATFLIFYAKRVENKIVENFKDYDCLLLVGDFL